MPRTLPPTPKVLRARRDAFHRRDARRLEARDVEGELLRRWRESGDLEAARRLMAGSLRATIRPSQDYRAFRAHDAGRDVPFAPDPPRLQVFAEA